MRSMRFIVPLRGVILDRVNQVWAADITIFALPGLFVSGGDYGLGQPYVVS